MFENEATQHSLEWQRQRLPCFTGSQVGLLMGKGRKKEDYFSGTAMAYIYAVAAGRFMNSKVVEDDDMFQDYLDLTSFNTKAMEWGTEQEGNARDMYARHRHVEIVERGLVEHPTIPFFASSPDGFIPKDNDGLVGCIEIKCPKTSTFMEYAHKIHDNETLKAVQPTYYYQCQSHIACCKADYTDFIVYNPVMSKPMCVTRILPDTDALQEIAERINKANGIVAEIISNIKQTKWI